MLRLHLEKDRGFGDTFKRFTQWIRVPKFLKKLTPKLLKKKLPDIDQLDKLAEWFAVRILKRESCGCANRQKVWNTLFPYTRLIIALPHRNDWEGIWGTLHSLRKDILFSGLQNKIEILVVDQSPELNRPTPSETNPNPKNSLEVFCESISKTGITVRYEKFSAKLGSASAKQYGIAKAKHDWVLTLDCHIDLEEGSLQRTVKWLSRNYKSKNMMNGVLIHDNREGYITHLDLWETPKHPWEKKIPKIGNDLLWGKWGHPIPEASNPKHPPIEIEAAGGWCLLTRRDSFPGYSPWLSGFGGEEGYTHETVRRLGNKVMLLPALRGWHRFNRTHPVDYGPDEATIKNHAKSWVALGYDISLLRDALVKVRDADWIDDQIAIALSEMREAPTKAMEEARERRFDELCKTSSDINEHLPILRTLASRVRHITEFGTNDGSVTTAFLCAQPQTVITYSIEKNCKCKNLENFSGDTNLVLKHGPKSGNTIAIDPIAPTDFLFIDEIHTAERVSQQLTLHASQVSSLIGFHDTTTFGEFGEHHTEEKPVLGIQHAVTSFLQENPEWREVVNLKNNNGLLILARITQENPNLSPEEEQADVLNNLGTEEFFE